MIATVILFVGGAVMVFDDHGEQMPDYQGRAGEVAARLLRDAPVETTWHFGRWRQGSFELTREEWQQIALPLSADDLDPREP